MKFCTCAYSNMPNLPPIGDGGLRRGTETPKLTFFGQNSGISAASECAEIRPLSITLCNHVLKGVDIRPFFLMKFCCCVNSKHSKDIKVAELLRLGQRNFVIFRLRPKSRSSQDEERPVTAQAYSLELGARTLLGTKTKAWPLSGYYHQIHKQIKKEMSRDT